MGYHASQSCGAELDPEIEAQGNIASITLRAVCANQWINQYVVWAQVAKRFNICVRRCAEFAFAFASKHAVRTDSGDCTRSMVS